MTQQMLQFKRALFFPSLPLFNFPGNFLSFSSFHRHDTTRLESTESKTYYLFVFGGLDHSHHHGRRVVCH
jgi:hypothetical protein